MEDQSVSKTNENARARAEQIVKEALRVIMQDTSYWHDQDCLRTRAEIGIRFIADILCRLSEAYQLDPDLRAALNDVHFGFEPYLPEDLRQFWENHSFGHQHDPPDEVQ